MSDASRQISEGQQILDEWDASRRCRPATLCRADNGEDNKTLAHRYEPPMESHTFGPASDRDLIGPDNKWAHFDTVVTRIQPWSDPDRDEPSHAETVVVALRGMQHDLRSLDIG